jgi:flagellar protein FliS
MTYSRQEVAPSKQTAVRSYVASSVATMSPGRMIVALYDRLLLDLERAAMGFDSGAPELVHECLLHAQTIVAELHDSLERENWSGANNLADLYLFIYNELVTANLEKNAAKVTTCRELLTPLRDAWNEAAGIVSSGADGEGRA